MPVVLAEHSGAHHILLAWDLEPAVLGAVLKGPRAGWIHWVNLSLGDDACIVVRRIHIGNVVAELRHVFDNIIVSALNCLEQLAQLGPIAVLD